MLFLVKWLLIIAGLCFVFDVALDGNISYVVNGVEIWDGNHKMDSLTRIFKSWSN